MYKNITFSENKANEILIDKNFLFAYLLEEVVHTEKRRIAKTHIHRRKNNREPGKQAMSTMQLIQTAERLPLWERLDVIEALYASIKRELAQKTTAAHSTAEEPFELITFNLGQEVHADRDEIYAERGL